jgi:4-amino-4-deoxy-L-arabinose transferase-like glycosyltransferase
MTTNGNLSPQQAQELLSVAEAGIAHGESAGRRSWLGAAMSIGIGALVSAFFLAAIYVFPTASWQLVLAISLGYAVGIIAAVTIYNLQRRVSPAGWLKRFQRGLFLTTTMVAIILGLSFLIPERSPLLWFPLAILAGLPLAVIGSRKVSR